MPLPSSKVPPTGYPEFAVRAETIGRFFSPPLASSTFHDYVNKGMIVPMKGVRGFYKLNDSLRRLGLREVPILPGVTNRSTEDIARLAFTMIDPLIFPAPSWMLKVEELDARDIDHARLLADVHRESIEALGSAEEKLAYLQGVLDAQMMEAEDRSAGE